MTDAPPRAAMLDADAALAFLAQASGVLAGSLDYERTLSEVAQLAVPDVADWCAVDVVDSRGATREITSGHPDPEQEALLRELRRRYRAAKGATEGASAVIATGEPELVEDVDGASAVPLDRRQRRLYERLAPRSYMIVPLIARARTIGALTLLSTRAGRHYREADLEFAQQLARRFAMAVDNARIYDEAERARGLLDTFFSSAPVGLGFFAPDGGCVRASKALAQITGLGEGSVAGLSIDRLVPGAGAELKALHLEVLEHGEAVLERDLTTTDTLEPRHLIVSASPVKAADDVVLGVGVVLIDVTERRELLERERAGRRRATLLARAGELLESSLDYETTLANVARIAVPEIAEWCAIHVRDDAGGIRLVALSASDPERERVAWEINARYPMSGDSRGGPAGVIRSGRTQVVEQISDAQLERGARDAVHLGLLRELGMRALIAAPLRARGRTLGSVLFGSSRERRFDVEDVGLAEEIARRAGLAVDNARLYTERSHIAHTLQTELLPATLPRVPGIEVAVRYRAAGELNEVGGDFYDVFHSRNGDWAFVIGDVSGKGAEAAAVTALARHTMRTASLQPVAPLELLTTLNDALLSHRSGAEFCTVCLAHVQANGGAARLRVALGGHPPALILRADGGVVAHGAPGTLLGVFEDPALLEVEGRLLPGDTVLLYTDGVTEAGPTGQEIGERGLRDLLATLHGCPPDQIVGAVEAAAVAAAEGERRDDIALLAFRILES